ncbi:MAG: hypothetical protein FJX54_20585 [Alphaproteobacteria bacterium]|nr:hypothetical protein [Alphaproteobacteria bacterium]
MALENSLNAPVQVGRTQGAVLSGFLRDCANELDGLNFSRVKVNYTEIEHEVLNDLQKGRAFRLRERRTLLVGAKLNFSIADGQVNVVDQLGVKGVEFIRAGRTAGLLKEYGPDDPYNACVVMIITKLLSMGITDVIELGQPLPESVLIFLQPPQSEEEAVRSSVDVVMGALSRFKALSPAELIDFADKYRTIAGRLAGCGIPKFRLTADRILTTIQQEAVRACVRIDVWHRVWRAFNEAMEPAQELRNSEAVKALPANVAMADKIIQAFKRQIVVMQQHLLNLDRLKATVVKGKQFYIDSLLLIIYVYENKQAVEDMFAMRVAWTDACKSALAVGSMQGVQNALLPHEQGIDDTIAMPLPPTVKPV